MHSGESRQKKIDQPAKGAGKYVGGHYRRPARHDYDLPCSSVEQQSPGCG
jgi:hypothetical protein